uniref:Uncharacterized protein n=1 Tax=Theropithecus gelada TaxID=9565 RepID=A0A8D2ESN7_THEGE
KGHSSGINTDTAPEIFSYLPVWDQIRVSRCSPSCGTCLAGTWHSGSIPCRWAATCSLAPDPVVCNNVDGTGGD